MRHLLITATLIAIALMVTFGTATVLQDMATARKDTPTMPQPAVASPSTTAPGKPRPAEQSRQLILAGRRFN